MDKAPAVFVGRLEGCAKRRTGAAKRPRDLVFEVEVATADQGHIRRHTTERVRFVHKAGGQNARHGSSLADDRISLLGTALVEWQWPRRLGRGIILRQIWE